jgi:hypothetical protein
MAKNNMISFISPREDLSPEFKQEKQGKLEVKLYLNENSEKELPA